MGGVLDDDHPVPVGPFDDAGIEIAGRGLAGGAVGIAEDEELRAGEDVGRDAVEVGEKVVLCHQRQPMDRAAEPARGGARDRIAGNGHERDITRVDEGRGEHRVGGLRADAMVDFGDGVERDAKLPLHEGGDGLLVLRDAVVGVAAVLGAVDLLVHHRSDSFRSHLVVLADPEVEHPPFRMVGDGLTLGPLDELELVDLVPLAVLGPADAGGETVLEPGILRDGGGGGAGHGWGWLERGSEVGKEGEYRGSLSERAAAAMPSPAGFPAPARPTNTPSKRGVLGPVSAPAGGWKQGSRGRAGRYLIPSRPLG